MKFKLATVSLTFLLIIFLVVPHTLAYNTVGFKLIGGVKDRLIYVDGGTSNFFYDSIMSAVNNWNTINPAYITPSQFSSTDVSFTRSTTKVNSQIHVYTLNYGNTGWYGAAFYYNSSGIDSPGLAPTKNYNYSEIRLNRYTGPGIDIRLNTWTAVAGHEIGHSLGLFHENGIGVLMDYNIAFLTSPIFITNDEIAGIRSLY